MRSLSYSFSNLPTIKTNYDRVILHLDGLFSYNSSCQWTLKQNLKDLKEKLEL